MKQILTGQFEASLAMLAECVRVCPDDRWEERIAALTFRQIAYHTLYCTDLYLSATEETFALRELHNRGGDERAPGQCTGLTRDETLAYADICRQKMIDAIATESEESLAGPSGFSWRRFSRGEMHIYNIRHVQHHAGQLSAFLRRTEAARFQDRDSLPWVATGWPRTENL